MADEDECEKSCSSRRMYTHSERRIGRKKELAAAVAEGETVQASHWTEKNGLSLRNGLTAAVGPCQCLS